MVDIICRIHCVLP